MKAKNHNPTKGHKMTVKSIRRNAKPFTVTHNVAVAVEVIAQTVTEVNRFKTPDTTCREVTRRDVMSHTRAKFHGISLAIGTLSKDDPAFSELTHMAKVCERLYRLLGRWMAASLDRQYGSPMVKAS